MRSKNSICGANSRICSGPGRRAPHRSNPRTATPASLASFATAPGFSVVFVSDEADCSFNREVQATVFGEEGAGNQVFWSLSNRNLFSVLQHREQPSAGRHRRGGSRLDSANMHARACRGCRSRGRRSRALMHAHPDFERRLGHPRGGHLRVQRRRRGPRWCGRLLRPPGRLQRLDLGLKR